MRKPSTKPKDLKDGYYIELKNKNEKNGIMIRRDTLSQLKKAIEQYKINKQVEILGQVKEGKLIDI